MAGSFAMLVCQGTCQSRELACMQGHLLDRDQLARVVVHGNEHAAKRALSHKLALGPADGLALLVRRAAACSGGGDCAAAAV